MHFHLHHAPVLLGALLGAIKRYLTDQELAASFGVSRRTTARWRETRAINFLRLPGGQKVLYLLADVCEFEKRFKQPAKRDRGRPRKVID